MAKHYNSNPGPSKWQRETLDLMSFPSCVDQWFKPKKIQVNDPIPQLVDTKRTSPEHSRNSPWGTTDGSTTEYPFGSPSQGMYGGKNYFSCWDGPDILGQQRYQMGASNSSPSKSSDSEEDTATTAALLLQLDQVHISFSADDIFIYPRVDYHAMDNTTIFYIEAAPGKVLQKGYFFSIYVTWPAGYKKQLIPYQDKTCPDRYFCSFVPTETGKFTISVKLTAPKTKHVRGSPLEILVSRNYSTTLDYNLARIGFNPDATSLAKAWGLAVHRPTNTIFMADRDNHLITILDSNGIVKRRFGKLGKGKGQLYRPTGIAVDSKRNRVFVTDKDNHRVSIFTLDGVFINDFGKKGHHNGEFNYPWGVAVSPNGENIAVADSRNHRVQLFDFNGYFLRKYSVFESNPFEYKSEFNYPRGITFNADGTKLFVTDFNIHAVFVLNLELTSRTTFIEPGKLHRPQGITVDEAGNILVADSKNNYIRVVAPNGAFLYDIPGSGSDAFDMPMDLVVLDGGKIAVTDGVNRLRIF